MDWMIRNMVFAEGAMRVRTGGGARSAGRMAHAVASTLPNKETLADRRIPASTDSASVPMCVRALCDSNPRSRNR